MARQKAWHKLDNTANLFPVIAGRRTANVFRMTAVMHKEVVPEYLQQALEETLPAFAAFSVRLRHGLFWSYLEQNDAPVHIAQETHQFGNLSCFNGWYRCDALFESNLLPILSVM